MAKAVSEIRTWRQPQPRMTTTSQQKRFRPQSKTDFSGSSKKAGLVAMSLCDDHSLFTKMCSEDTASEISLSSSLAEHATNKKHVSQRRGLPTCV